MLILHTKDKLSKFDPKPDPGVFLRYSFVSKLTDYTIRRLRLSKRPYTYPSKRKRRI